MILIIGNFAHQKTAWVVIVVHWESHGSRATAMKRERFLKTGYGRVRIKARLATWLANPPSLP